jgi:hypothetical protein
MPAPVDAVPAARSRVDKHAASGYKDFRSAPEDTMTNDGPRHPLVQDSRYATRRGRSAPDDSFGFLSGGLPVAVADVRVVAPRERGDGVRFVVVDLIIDLRPLDPRGERKRTTLRVRFLALEVGPGGDVRLAPGRNAEVEAKEPRDDLFHAVHKPGGIVKEAIEAAKANLAALAPCVIRPVIEQMSARARYLDEVEIPEAEEKLEGFRLQIEAGTASEWVLTRFDRAPAEIAQRRGRLADLLEIQALLARCVDRAEGVATDASQRAEQMAARVIDEREQARREHLARTTEIDAVRAARARARDLSEARKERLRAEAETLLGIVRDALGCMDPGLAERARSALARVEGAP